MRIYYAMEALGLRHHVRSALGVDAGAWNQVSHRVRHWRRELQDRYGIPAEGELSACGLATGAGESPPACNCAGRPTPTPRQGAKVLAGGLRLIEDLAVGTGGASPSSMSASTRRTYRRTAGSAWTGCSTGSTPPPPRRAATPWSYSATDPKRRSPASTTG